MSDSSPLRTAGRPGMPQQPTPSGRGVPAVWLALLAGPLSFGIAGPSLILPDAARDLGVSLGAATWIVTAFGWAIALGTPLMAGLQNHQGVRRALSACTALVALGAVLVAAVPSLPVLMLGSAAQGLGTAGFTTIAMSLTRSARSMGLVTSSLATVGAAAPLITDLTAGALSWRAGLALPALSLLAVPGVLHHRPADPSPESSFDPRGAALLTALVTALVFVPHSWPPAAACALTAGGLLWLHLRTRPDGFVPASILRAPVFLLTSGLAFLLAAVNFAMIYLLPALLTEQTGWSSGAVGMVILWPLLFGGVASYATIAATAKAPVKTVAVLFPGLAATGAVLAGAAASPVLLLTAQALTSLAAASGQGAFAARAAAAVPGDARATAMGQFNLCYLLGAAFGPAIAATLTG
ncbi:MFS transporter [Planobispora rosea]|uniref:MFS transporter n=1 Tax=Planobispora rosea TaxID=35762 RepID=UPI001FD493CA|nr:MFS transporter [Planobispora rosea]